VTAHDPGGYGILVKAFSSRLARQGWRVRQVEPDSGRGEIEQRDQVPDCRMIEQQALRVGGLASAVSISCAQL